MMATTDALARIHDALPDDAEIAALGHEFISMYIEYIEQHGYTPEMARGAAIKEVIAGIRAAVDLRAEGYIK